MEGVLGCDPCDDDAFDACAPRYSRPIDDNLPLHVGRRSNASLLRQSRAPSNDDEDLGGTLAQNERPPQQIKYVGEDDDVERMTAPASKSASRAHRTASDQPLLEAIDDEEEALSLHRKGEEPTRGSTNGTPLRPMLACLVLTAVLITIGAPWRALALHLTPSAESATHTVEAPSQPSSPSSRSPLRAFTFIGEDDADAGGSPTTGNRSVLLLGSATLRVR